MGCPSPRQAGSAVRTSAIGRQVVPQDDIAQALDQDHPAAWAHRVLVGADLAGQVAGIDVMQASFLPDLSGAD